MLRRPVLGAILAVAAVCVLAAGLSRDARPPAHPAAARPNVVFILTDDLSWDLVQYMPHVQALQRRGETFDHYFVADSLCCPSRATIFTGEFPHNTGVVSNTAPLGGYAKFQARGLAARTFAVGVRRRGYATSLLGKYLNGYGDPVMRGRPIPPGWSDWHVSNRTGYREFDYALDNNGRVAAHASAYGVDDLASTRDRVHRACSQAVPARGGDVRPARPVHAGAAQRARLPGADGAARSVLRRGQRRRSRLAGAAQAVERRAARPHRCRLPQARAGG